MSRIYQVKFLLNPSAFPGFWPKDNVGGRDRTEKIPAATPYDAIKYIQAKYAPYATYVYRVTVVSTEAEMGVRP